jgi:hypothetical protein
MKLICSDCGPVDHIHINPELSGIYVPNEIPEDLTFKLLENGELTMIDDVEPNADYTEFTTHYVPVPDDMIGPLRRELPNFKFGICPKCEDETAEIQI